MNKILTTPCSLIRRRHAWRDYGETGPPKLLLELRRDYKLNHYMTGRMKLR